MVDVLKASVPQDRANCPYCRQVISVFDVICNGEALIKRPDTIFGGIYVQGNTIGLASYHFQEEESYISYSAAPPFWRLDDGSSPPVRKPFENSSYDPLTRTFNAVVHWSPVTFHGDLKWNYRIVFSEDFMTISGGEVTAYQNKNVPSDVHVYGQHLVYARVFDIDELLAD